MRSRETLGARSQFRCHGPVRPLMRSPPIHTLSPSHTLPSRTRMFGLFIALLCVLGSGADSPTPFPTFTGSAGSYTSSFESYKGDGDVSGDGLWNTGVNFNQWSVHSGSTKSGTTGPDSAYDGSYYLCTCDVGSSKSLLGSLPGLCMNPHRLRDERESLRHI